MRWRALGASLLATTVIAAGIVAVGPAPRAEAATFDPGYIISDERFFDHTAMSQAQIQRFLDEKVPTCRSTDSTLPCLKDLVTSTSTRAPVASNHCTGYDSEGWESAARIIWRVAQACRINPQVLLVTLQKEQSLVTATRPTAYQYRAAMGYDCPDTAPCAPSTLGFFNQVYKAAWQFRQYAYNTNGWRHRIGTVPVLFHPNSSCGSSDVYIRNQATVGLYNYTPYQPNAAALANLYGTGDACSSYGNRNFWRFFNDWFGDSTANGVPHITALYAQLGAENGILGSPTSLVHSITEAGGGTAQAFANGSIYWTIRTGAAAVLEPQRSTYFSYGGATGRLGWPSSQLIQMAGGAGQAFTGGSLFTSGAGTYATFGLMRDIYFQRGGATGSLGYPTAAESALTGGSTQPFQNATLFVQTNGWGGAVSTSLLSAYQTAGGPSGALGWPRSDTVTIAGGGTGQLFERGSLFSSAAGTHAVSGAMRDAYFLRGGATGSLGYPAGPEVAVAGGSSQPFQGGTLFLEPGGKTWTVSPGVRTAYDAAGGPSGALGWPRSDSIAIAANGGGTGQAFENGSVYASAAGAFAVSGAVRDHYFTLDGAVGGLGWPTSAQTCQGGECRQSFQGGTIYQSASGYRIGHPPIETYWQNSGGATGPLGARTSAAVRVPENGGGFGQTFSGGSVYSSGTGTFAVRGAVRDLYWSLGGSAGSLGWPTADAVCADASTCRQTFQNGTIFVEPSSGAYIGLQSIDDVWWERGGPQGELGRRTSGLIRIPENGGGHAMVFSAASIYASAQGAFAVSGSVRTTYFTVGGSAGPLGWPTGAQTCANGTCTQQFQAGTITASAAGGTITYR